eukprot:Platyproteum_vivax@DN14470_c0_g1_i1.p1
MLHIDVSSAHQAEGQRFLEESVKCYANKKEDSPVLVHSKFQPPAESGWTSGFQATGNSLMGMYINQGREDGVMNLLTSTKSLPPPPTSNTMKMFLASPVSTRLTLPSPCWFDPPYVLSLLLEDGQRPVCRLSNDTEEGDGRHSGDGRRSEGIIMEHAASLLCGGMGHYSCALKMALSCKDITLAKHCASTSADKKVRRRLWLHLAKYLTEHQMYTEAIEVVKDPQSSVTIQDCLAYMYDSRIADCFRNEICLNLDSYETKIQTLWEDMAELRKTIQKLEVENKVLDSQSLTLNTRQPCLLCNTLTWSRKFIFFPCGHCFHMSCIQEVICNPQYLSHNNKVAMEIRDSPNPSMAALDALCTEECVLCGRWMVDACAQMPLVYKHEQADWTINSFCDNEP